MNTLWDEPARLKIIDRFHNLSPASRPAWGKLSAGQMIHHCTDGLRMFIGEKKVTPKSGPLRNPLVRHLVIHWLPWPKGAPTAPELIPPPYQGNWQTDLAELEAVINRIAARGPSGTFDPHRAFGSLSANDVGALAWRHLDHHLRQFGL
jgi:hypothetical protein